MWPELGYVEALKKNYRLILIDVRGHGLSDKPHDSEKYMMELIVSDVFTVLDHARASTLYGIFIGRVDRFRHCKGRS